MLYDLSYLIFSSVLYFICFAYELWFYKLCLYSTGQIGIVYNSVCDIQSVYY